MDDPLKSIAEAVEVAIGEAETHVGAEGPSPPRRGRAGPGAGPASTDEGADGGEGQAPEFSDEALALRFAALHEADLRYVSVWGKYLIFDGRRWVSDVTLAGFDRVRALNRSVARQCQNSKTAVDIASAKRVAAVERLARADRRLAATAEEWDLDSLLFNTPAGTVDLRSGDLKPHRQEDQITKIAAVGPRGDCPRWDEFLRTVTGGDAELAAYLRRVAGYCLTGETTESALFFLYGLGANGKSVFIATLAGVMADYARTAPIETFTASAVDRHPTDIAGLRGARLVTATETEDGRRWAESRIKQLTGGDMISARFMRGDFFEFRPTFKLVIAGNHKPGLRSVDEAIRRRFHLIPFAVTIPPEDRDPGLAEKLRAEWPGILAWAIEGALEWRTEGLRQPQAVRDATADYLEAEDSVAAWIDDRCEQNPAAWETSASLFASWSHWATKAGEFIGSAKKFTQRLEARGFARDKIGGVRAIRGLSLKTPPADESSSNPDEGYR
ncbi:P4 family phage/plasmid primase-like protein [Roseiarcus fermentans]|uniref:P4 family phage/plasmid primase-like protein n=1 Tax=Roseiarcus fermentans TaxID=1473586 RepID=A0A366F1K7_9HYPH|nr:phage/plasmid primase, P4 family [Roseiarcus fermentans]RBP08521.1 P4 family phage/plasmid primase-like protein [Roseiarcus fermentans]